MKQCKIYDVSLTIRPGMAVYPGDLPMRKETIKSIARDYELFCLPVKIEDGDGAPARIFLRELP